jgi:hypothetical protein
VPLGRGAGSLQYRAYAGHTNLDPTGGYLKLFADQGLVFTRPPGGKAYGGDLRWVALRNKLTIGASAQDQVEDGSAPWGKLHLAPFLIMTEYAQFEYKKFYGAAEFRRAPITPVPTIGPVTVPIPLDEHVWYVMASYPISSRLQLGSYFSHYLNKAGGDAALPENHQKDWDISGRWNFNDYFYVKLEEHFLHGTALGYYTSTNPGGLKPRSNILAAKVGFSF